MRTSKRLKAITEFIDENDKIIDIGCDHALLDIYLKEEYPNINVIATDISEGAIKQAKRSIQRHNLDEKIDVRIGDGLTVADTEEYDTIVISGMGFYTIKKILSNQEKIKNVKKIIIQSNTDIVKLRKYIIKLGYKISREKLIEDKDIIYTIIEFIPGVEKYDYKQIYFGPRLMENKDELFNDYYSKKLLKYENLLLQLPNNNIVSKLHHKKLIKILKEEVKVNE
ncbi:MAG: SAM-dependent methyltransferase [Bacilli bacterium]|nr:SAM-dependent methyltransferase [Bacilli bacterium]